MLKTPGRKNQRPAILCLLAAVLWIGPSPASAREDEDKDPEPPDAPPLESAAASVVVISSPAQKPAHGFLGEPRTKGFLGYGFLITADGLVATCDSVLPETLPDNRVHLTDVNGETYWGDVLKRDDFSGFAILRMKLPDLRLRISLLKPSPLRSAGGEVIFLRSPATTASPSEPARLAGFESENAGMSVFHLENSLPSRAEGFPVIDKDGLLLGIAGRKSGFPSAGALGSPESLANGEHKGIAVDELVVVPCQSLLNFVNEWLEDERNRILKLPAESDSGETEEADPDNPFILVPRVASGEELEQPFGLGIAALDDSLAAELGLDPGSSGIVITRVEKDSPASRAGLLRGLVIYQIGGQEISTLDDVAELSQNIPSQELTEFVVGIESSRTDNISVISMSRKYLNAR